MQLVINSRGAYLSKIDERFQVKLDGVKQEVSAKKVERILITTSATITTDALKLAIENNIDIVFLQYNGEPFARLWHSKLGSICTIRRKQLKLSEEKLGTVLVKSWIIEKMNNQVNHLEKLKVNRSKEKGIILEDSMAKIKIQIEKIKVYEDLPIDNIRNNLEGHEGTAAKIYFETLGKVIPAKYSFNGRSRNPAKDYFNCMLNYAYGILYSKVERGCVIAGLDPYIGIMHTDNYNKTSLIFDLVEKYRIYMDEVVFSLFSKRMVKENMFDNVDNGFWLNKEGKILLIDSIDKKFDERIRYNNRLIKIDNIIQYDLHNIANKILEEVI